MLTCEWIPFLWGAFLMLGEGLVTGSVDDHWRRNEVIPSRAISSRIGTPPISNMTRPLFTLQSGWERNPLTRGLKWHAESPSIQKFLFLSPYVSHFPNTSPWTPSGRKSRANTHLHTNWDIREYSQVDLRTLDYFYLPLDNLLSSGQLLSSQPDTLALYP